MGKNTLEYPVLRLELPAWFAGTAKPGERFASLEERMRYVIGLAATNIDHGTGGPFGSAIFEAESGRLIAPGVNLVTSLKCSLAHAESVALALAQQALGTYDLSAAGLPPLELVTSAQPCVQCFGNIWWAGPARVVIGASAHDVESLTGLCEGPLPDDWRQQLEQRDAPLRPIEVVTGVLAEESRAVLKRYVDEGGLIYNACSDGVSE